jgi:hypothetical protein
MFKFKPKKYEYYVVREPFVLYEWGDMYGDTENSKLVQPGAEIVIESYKGGRIKRMLVDGWLWGAYKLLQTKAEITSFCERVG